MIEHAYLPPSHSSQSRPHLFLSHAHNTFSINNIEIVSVRAQTTYQLMRVLVEQWLFDYENGLPCDSHTMIPLYAMAERIMAKGIEIKDLDHLCRLINRLRCDIKEKLAAHAFPIDCQDCIENIRSGGYKNKTYGYRLNPLTIVLAK